MKTLTLLTPLLLSGLKPKAREYTLYDAQCDGLALRVQPSGSFSWVLWERNNRQARRVTLGACPDLSPDEARRQFQLRRSGGALPQPKAQKTLDFATLCTRFLETKRQTYKPSTLPPLEDYLRAQLLPAFGKKQVGKITPAEVAEWFYAYSRKRPGGANQALGHFTVIFNWGKTSGNLPSALPNPAAPIRKNRRLARGRMLNLEQLKALAAVLDYPPLRCEQAALAIRLILLTGCRSGEILGLTWAEVKPAMLKLRDAKTGPRAVLLSKPARQLMGQLRDDRQSPFVFPSSRSKTGHLEVIDVAWRTIKAKAGLPADTRIHDLRHTYASHAILSGETLTMTSKLLGHASERSTRRYAHLDGSMLGQAAELVSREIERLMEG